MKCEEAVLFRGPCTNFEASNIIKIIMDCVGFLEQFIGELLTVLEKLILN